MILVGHSMGGFAIREYLQNSRKLANGRWSASHVAELITVGNTTCEEVTLLWPIFCYQ